MQNEGEQYQFVDNRRYNLELGWSRVPPLEAVDRGWRRARLLHAPGEPDLRDYLKANEASKIKLDHLVKPSVERGSNPYHYVVVRVDGDKLDMEVIGVDWGSGFQPYRSNKVELRDTP